MTEPGEEFFGGILAAVLPSLISTAFNRFGSALDAAGKEHTWQATAFTNFELNKDNMPRCVQIVRGEFLPPGTATIHAWMEPIPAYTLRGTRFANEGIRLARRPDFFFEGVFRESSDKSVMAIVPIFADFTEPIGDRALRTDKTRNVSLTFAFHPPGKSATDATNASTNLVLGELTPGALIHFDYSCVAKPTKPGAAASNAPAQPGSSSGGPPSQPGGAPPQPAGPAPRSGGARQPAAPHPATGEGDSSPQAAAAAPVAAATRACADESLWFKLTRGEALGQLSLTAATTEVQGKNEFLVFLSDVFKGSKEGLETLAQQALIEGEREKARLAAIQASNEAAVAYDQAATAALTALQTCSTDGSIASAGAARVKQHGANLAAARAGIPQPFRQLVPLNGTPDQLKKECLAAIGSFE
jgi:hypothetical protein